jgi:CoA:oxalate CoA-transferase
MTLDVALPLDGITVLDFSQYLAGPGAALRLADLGASVIKVESPRGDNGRWLGFRGGATDEVGTRVFKTINRNKSSLTADLKNPDHLAEVLKLVKDADVVIQNFRPGVIERLGLGYETVAALNPRLVYASVSGYGLAVDWSRRPGQDLLAQATVGIPFINGSIESVPVAIGSSIADLMTAQHLVQGILACLVRRASTGRGALVEVSLFESTLDTVFEGFTEFLNTGAEPQRGPQNSAHPEMPSPYGIYKTLDGYLALSLIPIDQLAELLSLPELVRYAAPGQAFANRSAVVPLVAERMKLETTAHWLEILTAADAWCSEVFTWSELVKQPAFLQGDLIQTVDNESGESMRTTRCPIRIDGHVITSPVGAPRLGPLVANINPAMPNNRIGD